MAKGTHVIVPLVEELADDRWEATVVKQVDEKIMLSVNSSPTAAIGRYRLTVETNSGNGVGVSKHDAANDVFLLFNPWCEGKAKDKRLTSLVRTQGLVQIKYSFCFHYAKLS